MKKFWNVLFLMAACLTVGTVFGGECATCGGEADAELGCSTCGDPMAASCAPAACCDFAKDATPWRQTHFCNFDMNGYINAGGMFNTRGAQYNLNHVNSDNEMGLDGAYLALVREAQRGCGCFDWGFGTDFMFGRDARFLSGGAGWDSDWNTGLRSSNYNNMPGGLTEAERRNYGFAMPQLYAEVSANYTKLKIGHFYTPMGYESARADSRFFYSLGRDFEMTPITHTGFQVAWNRIKNLEVTGGYVIGENNTFDENYNEHLFVGSIHATANPLMDMKYATIIGDGATQGYRGHLFRQSFVLKSQLTDRLETVFTFNNGSFDATENIDNSYSYTGSATSLMAIAGSDNLKYTTFGGHAYYKLNNCWKAGFRMEWQQATSDVSVDNEKEFEMDLEGIDIALGANWNPCGNDNLVMRPEIRYDRVTTPVFGRYLGTYKDQLTLGGDIMYRF